MDKLEVKQYLENIFHQEIQLYRTDKGISNVSYLMRMDDQTYMVRVPKKEHGLLRVDFKNEYEVLQKVKALDVPLVGMDIHKGIKVTKYIEGVHEFSEAKGSTKYEQTGKMLKTLHCLDGVDFYFDPFKKLSEYRSQVKERIVFFEEEEKIIEAVLLIYRPDTLCHNDVVSGNLLFSNCRSYLIDYEYAAMNDFRFDLASFFSENQIEDERSRQLFYIGYGIECSIDPEIRLFECFEDILWGYWANMLYDHSKEEIYRIIAKEKEAHFQRTKAMI